MQILSLKNFTLADQRFGLIVSRSNTRFWICSSRITWSHPQTMQILSLKNFTLADQRFSLIVSKSNTRFLVQPSPGNKYAALNVQIYTQQIQQMHTFLSLVSFLSITRTEKKKNIDYCILSTRAACKKSNVKIFCNQNLQYHTKIMVHHAVVISTHLWDLKTKLPRSLKSV